MTYLALTILFNLFLAAAFFYFHKNLHPFEVFTNWLFIAPVMEILKQIVFLNVKWIGREGATALFWTLECFRMVMIPCLTVWLFDLYVSKRFSRIGKMLLTFGWFFILIAFQCLNKAAGYLHFYHWNGIYSFFQWLVLYLLASGFAICFRTLLKKETFLA